MISFSLPLPPPRATSQTKRLVVVKGKPYFYHTAAHRAEAEALALSVAAYRPRVPMSGPVALAVEFVHPWRAKETAAARRAGWRWCDTRPDLDNMIKTLLDVMTRAGFWADDGQIADLRISKKWAAVPAVKIQLSHLE